MSPKSAELCPCYSIKADVINKIFLSARNSLFIHHKSMTCKLVKWKWPHRKMAVGKLVLGKSREPRGQITTLSRKRIQSSVNCLGNFETFTANECCSSFTGDASLVDWKWICHFRSEWHSIFHWFQWVVLDGNETVASGDFSLFACVEPRPRSEEGQEIAR